MRSARSNQTRTLLALTLLNVTFITACDSSSEPKKDIKPATIIAQGADTLRGSVGSPVNAPLTVTVKNKAGNPIDSVVVTFAVASGGGSVGATSVRTNAAGEASTTWTLGSSAGVQTVTATAGGLAPVTFAAVASPAVATAIAKAGGDAQTAVAGANVAVPPSVKVTDAFGNPVANVLVTFSVGGGGGSVTGAAANTNASGVAAVGAWKLGNIAGANTLVATTQNLNVTFSATGTAGTVAQVRFTNTAPTLTNGATFKLTAQTLDANNNVVPNSTIVYSSSNTAIATVDQNGTVTGTGAGTVNIIGTFGSVTGSTPVSVMGHPAGTLVGKAAMASQIRGLTVTATTAYAALSSALAVGGVTLSTAAALTPIPLGSAPQDVATGGEGPVIAAPTSGALPVVWFVSQSTQARTDSIELPVNPVKAVMNSTGTKLFVDLSNFSMMTIDVASRSVTSTISLAGTVTAMKMAFGDTLIYAGTVLGTVFEIDARTSTIRRQFNPSSSIASLDVSRDGKTLYTSNGTNTVTMTALAAGGRSGTIDFPATVNGLGVSPDELQLWVGMNGQVFAAPFEDGTFVTFKSQSVLPVTGGANLSRVVFSPLGDFAVVIDIAGNQLVVFR